MGEITDSIQKIGCFGPKIVDDFDVKLDSKSGAFHVEHHPNTVAGLQMRADGGWDSVMMPAPEETRGPTRATTLPDNAADRKTHPVATGVLDYFPDALVAVAHVSYVGNEQHNPGEALHWARGKSMDQADAMLRHLLQRGTIDTSDSHRLRHSAKMAWRALALLQLEIEAERL